MMEYRFPGRFLTVSVLLLVLRGSSSYSNDDIDSIQNTRSDAKQINHHQKLMAERLQSIALKFRKDDIMRLESEMESKPHHYSFENRRSWMSSSKRQDNKSPYRKARDERDIGGVDQGGHVLPTAAQEQMVPAKDLNALFKNDNVDHNQEAIGSKISVQDTGQGQGQAVGQDGGGQSNDVEQPDSTNKNVTSAGNSNNSTTTASSTSPAATTESPEETPDLPPKGAAEEEHHSSLTIFFILLVVAISILVVHLLIQTRFHYLPDSIAIVLIGALIGLVLKIFKFGNWKNEEAFPPTVFFIVLLPPIIFEGGYNLHKGNFFHNIGSILIFAVFGTIISAVVVGGGIYLLGQADVVYKFDIAESFAFGSLISAVDPVATLAIFQALDVDPILYMLVFGESMLNDAVSIVLTSTILEFASPAAVITSGTTAFFQAVGRFCLMFFASSAIGVAFGLLSAVMTKFIDLHKTPSLEVGMVFCFSYLPYALAEGIHLSGIMAILFCGIVMSHYTHFNLSPVSQITVQQTFRTIAFIAETCVFAYLGLAIFSFKVNVKPAFTIWGLILILLGRACNIFPLSFIMNFFREHKITRKNQFIMWFSGLRGAIAFALSLHLEFESEKHYIMVTSTLIIVLCTLVFLGGSTMPLLKFVQTEKRYKKKKKEDVSMSKTKEMGDAIDSEHLSELTEEDENYVMKQHLKGFLKLDAKYLIPFFTKRFTQQEVRDGRSLVDSLATKWVKEVRAVPSESEDEGENIEMETALISHASPSHNRNGIS